ncbi:hypothetical protein BASA83_005915 [Batrachochytrium salamandrivorans]|nr:hypothetical protein BASA83_005915 [Batrachochytrium salamandrivorans]
MRSTDSDRSVRATPKKARDASPPPPGRSLSPLPPTGATSKRKTVATKPNPATTTATTTTTTTTGQPLRTPDFADAVKRRPTHQQLVERRRLSVKPGASAWLALKTRDFSPCTQCTESGALSGLRLIYASGFPYAKPGNLRKAMQGCPHPYQCVWTRTIVKSFKAWIPRSEAADKDKLAAISSFAVKTVTTIQRSPDVKARNFLSDLCSHLLVARPSRQPLLRRPRFGFKHPVLTYPHWRTVPKESLPVKKATDKEPAAPAVDSPSDMAAEPSRYHILRSILAPILGHQMEHVSKIDRRTTKYGARFRITVPEDRQRNIIQRLERQSKQTHWRIRQNYRHRRPDQTRPTAPPPPLSRQILAVNVANISNKRPAIRHIHPATGPGRRGIALGIPSCFGGHEHGSAVGTMILAKVPNFTPECMWIVGSVYVGHSGATTNYSRREAFASIRQALDRVVPFDNNHPVLIFGDWNTDPQRLQRIVHSWGHGLTVMQFSGSQITRLSTVHGRRHSSIDHFVCNAPARALLTSPRVDRQTAVADHFVIRTSIRAEAQGQPPAPRAPTISRHHCLEATDRIATSNYWDVLADVATDNTDTDTDIHQLTSQFLESANAVADNLSLRLSPPATRSNRRLLSGATKRAILASNTARQAFIAAATHTNPDPVQCNTLRDEWSRLKAAATQLERADGRKQWVKHADNLDRAVSDGRTDLVFSAARAMSGNSSRSAAVTPLYNSDGIVQYDPTSILRIMQGHYGSLAADTTGHSLDLQYWHDLSAYSSSSQYTINQKQ